MDYIVKTSDLLKVAKELVEEGMDCVEISLSEPDEELPAMVSFCAAEHQLLQRIAGSFIKSRFRHFAPPALSWPSRRRRTQIFQSA